MRIEISRSGGFAGMTRTWSLEVTSAEAEERWLPLADRAAAGGGGGGGTGQDTDRGTDQPAGPGGSRALREDAGRDRYVYHIVIGYQEVTLPESRLDEPWKELIDRARRESRG